MNNFDPPLEAGKKDLKNERAVVICARTRCGEFMTQKGFASDCAWGLAGGWCADRDLAHMRGGWVTGRSDGRIAVEVPDAARLA